MPRGQALPQKWPRQSVRLWERKTAASKAALADAMLREANKQHSQTAHSAVVCGAMKANVLLNAPRTRRNIRISPQLRKAAKQKPQAVPQQD